jgi:glycosyltransferase involved in cell wall biosynthesis
MRILHVFRTPVGGLFRHVRDLARGQQALGHEVGILCDSSTGGDTANRLLQSVESYCALGVKRIPISRLPGLGDISGARQIAAHARAIRPHIIHCHGAKGGLYGRLAARSLGIASIYTPHGGSLHYRWASPAGAAFLGAEWLLARIGSAIHFVCRYERDIFDAKIGIRGKPHGVVYNGLWPEEFAAAVPAPDAADILFIGDMRQLKGVDVLLEALALCNRHRPTTACLVGDGPDLESFKAQAQALGLAGLVTFPGRMAAAEAFKRGRLLVLPSRAESFPYVVLEAGAAGVPLIASDAGGIREVLDADHLVPPEDADGLAARIETVLADPSLMVAGAVAGVERIRHNFSAEAMVNGVLALYGQVGADATG